MNALLGRAQLVLTHGADPTIRNSSGTVPYGLAQTTNPDKSVQAEFREVRNLLSESSQQTAKPGSKSGVSRAGKSEAWRLVLDVTDYLVTAT